MHTISDRFNYSPLSRTDGKTRSYLTPDGFRLPSVTTILDRTKDKTHLYEWRKRVGEAKAAQITKEASGVGTAMHRSLEKYLKNEDRTPGSNLVQKIAYDMANVIIDKSLKPNFNELWGNEVSLYHTQLYAGTTDCLGVYQSSEAILDFKQTNKPKKKEWIEDYFYQIVAYGEAHNEMFNTKVHKGVILMCSRNLEFQEFILEGNDYQKFRDLWYKRLEEYYTKYHVWEDEQINTKS